MITVNLGWNIETYLSVSSAIISTIGIILFLKRDWKRYGLLLLLSAIVGVILCYIFLGLKLYSFPYRIFPEISKIPFTAILTVFPLYVLLGVQYSPKSWAWKIPFYWAVVHLGVLTEGWIESHTQILKYNEVWDLWDSYTWWWLYLLVFEWVGGLIIPQGLRKPLDQELIRFGQLGWFILHFILISTIFIAGVYAGQTLLTMPGR
ncbi:MAG: CBO0543 family protein [Solirubrobacterales bacterium]